MEISFANKLMVYASKRGYVADKDGAIYFKGRKRSLVIDSRGYLNFCVSMYNEVRGKRIISRVWVHRLQAYQKYGDDMFKEGVQVRHFNSNNKDNSSDNILIGTPSQNAMDKPEHLRKSMAINASYKNRILTNEQVKELIIDRSEGMSYGKLMKKYNISSKGTISFIIQKSLYFKKNNEENNSIEI